MAREEAPGGSDRARSRRSYLKLAGLAAVTAGVGGVAWILRESRDGTGQEARDADHRTVNLLEQGVDDTGQAAIDDALGAVAADDTTVRLPEGTYRIESFRPGPLSNFTLEGDGATLVPPEGSTDVFVGLEGTDVTLRGFTFDYSAARTAPQVAVQCADGLTVEDCGFVGVADVYGGQGRSGHQYHLMPAVTDPDGEGVVRNVRLADGSASPSNRGGIWVSEDSTGRLRFENVHLERWANNSLYASESTGHLEVVDSTFVNNDVSGPRIGAKTAEVRDTTVVSDGWVPVQGFTGSRKSRGLWIDDHCREVLVENCEFVMTGPYATDAIVFQDWSGSRSRGGLLEEVSSLVSRPTSIEVRNCRFVMAEGLRSVRHASTGAIVTMENPDVRTG